MRFSHTLLGYGLVILAALCWATIGIFYTVAIVQYGLHPLTVVAYRALLAALILGGLLSSRGPGLLLVRREHWGLFLAYVLLGVVVFYTAYAYAVTLNGVAVAAVLLYTAPAWVALIAGLFLEEPMTRRVTAALVLTWLGVILVVEAYDPGQLRLNGRGLVVGLGAGFLYGLYSVFQKVTVRYYRPWTVQWHGLFWGGLLLAVFQPRDQLLQPLQVPGVWLWLLGLALLATLVGNLAYTTGVQWIPVSVASILATLEPVAASALGYLVLGQGLQRVQLVGGALIILAVWLLRPSRQG